MAARTALSRLSLPLKPAGAALRPAASAALSTASSSSRLVSRNALASTPMARVARSNPRLLVEGARRSASTEEGGSTMVSRPLEGAAGLRLHAIGGRGVGSAGWIGNDFGSMPASLGSAPSSRRMFADLQTVREALNAAMEEEMLRDESVFIMGEEVARYNGAYKITKGLLDKFGEDRVIDVSRLPA